MAIFKLSLLFGVIVLALLVSGHHISAEEPTETKDITSTGDRPDASFIDGGYGSGGYQRYGRGYGRSGGYGRGGYGMGGYGSGGGYRGGNGGRYGGGYGGGYGGRYGGGYGGRYGGGYGYGGRGYNTYRNGLYEIED